MCQWRGNDFFHWVVGRHDIDIEVATSKCSGGTNAATYAAMEARGVRTVD